MRPCDFETAFNIWRKALALFGYTALYYIDRHGEYQIYISCGERRASCIVSIDGSGPFSGDEMLDRAIADLISKLQIDMIKDRRLSAENLGPSGRV